MSSKQSVRDTAVVATPHAPGNSDGTHRSRAELCARNVDRVANGLEPGVDLSDSFGLRLGLVGTGNWARTVHGPSAARHPDLDLIGVWGRDAGRTETIATELGIRAYADVDALVDDVDALTFAVPPMVQAPIALRAATRGRHLLLEKPIAISVDDALRLEDAVADAQVASIVFFTRRFLPNTQPWLKRVEGGDWHSGRAEMLVRVAASGWRREYGALWDMGPHALSLLWAALGPVSTVVARRGQGDYVQLILSHAGQRSSSVSLTLTAPSTEHAGAVYVDGRVGRKNAPAGLVSTEQSIEAHQLALDALLQLTASPGALHPCDVHLGARVVEVLAAAQRSLESGCVESVVG